MSIDTQTTAANKKILVDNVESNGDYCVYKHTSPSGKSYIGQTNNYRKRCREHNYSYNPCSLFYRAIKKHGWDNFKHEILIDDLSSEEANDWEGFYIFIENTVSPNGYNLKTGGDKVRLSDETIKKISAGNKGKIVTAEAREKMRVARTGKKASEKTLDKMRKAQTGKKASEQTKLKLSEIAKNVSAETRLKLSIASKGRKHTEEAKIKISNAKKGIPLSDEVKKKILNTKKNMSQEQKEIIRIKLSESHKGHKPSAETKKKMSLAQRNISDEKRIKMSESAKIAWKKRKGISK